MICEKSIRIPTDIPFRVIINHIFPYHLYTINESTGDVGLFGYFSFDRSRKLFFLFPCLRVLEKSNDVLMNLSLIEYFDLELADDIFLQRTFNHSQKKLIKLQKLGIVMRNLLFLNYQQLPNLRIMTFHILEEQYIGTSHWIEHENIFNSLQSFSILCDRNPELINRPPRMYMTTNNPKTWDCLKTLYLENLEKDQTTMILDLPKIENLILIDVQRGILILNEENTLKKFISKRSRIEILKEMKRMILNLEKLVLSLSDELAIPWLFEILYNLSNLKSLSLSNVYITNEPFMSSSSEIIEEEEEEEENELFINLKYLKLARCRFKEHPHDEKFNPTLLLNKHFINLETLILRNVENIISSSSKERNLLENLKNFSIGLNISDDLFQENNFRELEYLNITNHWGDIKGIGWNKIPHLKKLHLGCNGWLLAISDFLFHKDNEYRLSFQNLEELHLIKTTLSGLDWDISSNRRSNNNTNDKLKVIKIEFCTYFNIDQFFHQNLFSGLQKLKIRKCLFSGKDWKNLKNLRSLNIQYNEYLSDELFQSSILLNNDITISSFENLEFLKIKGFYFSLEIGKNDFCGKGWLYFPKICSFKILFTSDQQLVYLEKDFIVSRFLNWKKSKLAWDRPFPENTVIEYQ